MELRPNTTYHCQTREDAEAFLEECNKQNIHWCGGASTASRFQWSEHTCCYVIADHEENETLSIKYGSLATARDVFSDFPIIVYSLSTPEEVAARDLAWKQMMGVA